MNDSDAVKRVSLDKRYDLFTYRWFNPAELHDMPMGRVLDLPSIEIRARVKRGDPEARPRMHWQLERALRDMVVALKREEVDSDE